MSLNQYAPQKRISPKEILTLHLEGRYTNVLFPSGFLKKDILFVLYLSNTCFRQTHNLYPIKETTVNNYLHCSHHFYACTLAFLRSLNFYPEDGSSEVSKL
jgi:hypothetical protein